MYLHPVLSSTFLAFALKFLCSDLRKISNISRSWSQKLVVETFECISNDLRISYDSKFIRLTPPPATLEKPPTNPSPDQISLVDRMLEVQTLMLEIHQLELSDPEPMANNRWRVQELQRRVTELNDTQNSNVAISNLVLGPPPAYAQDGFIVYRCT
jgi:hypothetical protein